MYEILLADYQVWYERTYAGPFYKESSLTPSSAKGIKRLLKNNWKLCPVNSTRNAGRSGSLYHTIEYGRLYQMAVLSDPSTWVVQQVNGQNEYDPPKHLHAVTSKGH